jgi:cytochrome c553
MQINSSNPTIDWFPDRHPTPPPPVIAGRTGAYGACGQCHLIDASGKSDTADLRGLAVDYTVQQIVDMKDDKRHASIPQAPLAEMVAVSKGMTLDEARQAAEYFHSIKPVKRLRIVETGIVPVTHPGPHAVQVVDPSGAMEPIGTRIIEIPEDFERTELRNPSSGFVAYVPKGSIAGHSPTATARQLYDFKSGTRDGKNAITMKPFVMKLMDEDIVDLSAYVASLQP